VKLSTLAGGLGITALTNIMGNAIGAPWQALLAVTLVAIVCTTFIGTLQVLMPDESHDKVLLWNKFLTYRERRTSGPVKKRSAQRAVSATTRQTTNVIGLPRSDTTSQRTPARSP
jgi:uncharacterized membrane protein